MRAGPALISIAAVTIVLTVGAAPSGASPSPSSDGTTMRWRLAHDFRLGPNQSNPNPDSYGNPGVWRFMKGTTLHDPSSYSLFGKYIADAFGDPGLEFWRGPFFVPNNLPAVGINATGHDATPLGWIWPAHTILVHPYGNMPAIVGWHSPITGRVRISVTVADFDPGAGDGVGWFIDQGSTTLASGRIANGGPSQSVTLTRNVHAGSNLFVIVDDGGAGDFFFDSTRLAVSIHT